MRRHPLRLFGPLIVGVLVLLIGGRILAGFYTEVLWFNEVGYAPVFWTRLVNGLSVRLVTALVGGAIVFTNLWLVARRLGPVHVRRRYGNLEISEQIPRKHVLLGIVVAAALTGLWLSDVKFGGDLSLGVLTFLRRANWGIEDPLFHRDLSYYVFALPFYLQLLDFLLLIVVWSALLSVLGYTLVGAVRWRANRLQLDDRPRVHLAVLVGVVMLLLGVRFWFSRYGILYNGTGFGGGVGYTDIHARLPAQWTQAILSIIAGASVVYGAVRRSWIAPVAAVSLFIVAAVVLGYIYPSAIQKLRVEPNQLGREAAYIRWNIDFTRRAYGLDSLDRRAYAYRRHVPASAASLSQVPLWDTDPILKVLNQLQTGVGYYHFVDVDLDRYTANGVPQPVGIGVREFFPGGLQESNRTWQTIHLNPQYIHGIGAVVTEASKSEQGRPRYWLENLPIDVSPAAPPEILLTEPSIYFGETMEEYGILGTAADTSSSRVSPRGVPLNSFTRVLAFAWRFSEKNLLFSGQLTDSSRILFRRRLEDRLQALAPFILWDRDPQPVISGGRTIWVVDGYSLSPNYPIARPHRIEGVGDVRYLRNSVKATIDAVTGATTLYMLNESEPMLATYREIFPGLFHSIDEMPNQLRSHLRYPVFYLRAQVELLDEYHLDRPEAFYSGQDVWQLPGQRGGTVTAEPFQPVYSMLSVEPDAAPEFVLTAPFIARQRQVLTAFLVVRNDAPNYGQMVLFEMPRNQQVPGPTQVEALIEQDPVIAPQLTLWRQSGSDASLGNVRIVPIDGTLLYVIPLFLSAQGSPIPELQQILVSDGERVTMAPTLSEALTALRGAPESAPAPVPSAPTLPTQSNWSQRALRLLDEAEEALRNGDWAAYGARQRQLRELLQQAARQPRNE